MGKGSNPLVPLSANPGHLNDLLFASTRNAHSCFSLFRPYQLSPHNVKPTRCSGGSKSAAAITAPKHARVQGRTRGNSGTPRRAGLHLATQRAPQHRSINQGWRKPARTILQQNRHQQRSMARSRHLQPHRAQNLFDHSPSLRARPVGRRLVRKTLSAFRSCRRLRARCRVAGFPRLGS